jgi:hypothetical protein
MTFCFPPIIHTSRIITHQRMIGRTIALRIGAAGQPFADRAREVLAKNVLTADGLACLSRRRDWLQTQVKSFRLPPALPAAAEQQSQVPTPPEAQGQVPVVLMYGSSVAGTAFTHADADFCLLFPTAAVGEESSEMFGRSCGFVTLSRDIHPPALCALYDHLVAHGAVGDQKRHFSAESPESPTTPQESEQEEKENQSRLRLQRIFRARVPILQCLPPADLTTAFLIAGTAVDAPPTPNHSTTEKETSVTSPFAGLSATTPMPRTLTLRSPPEHIRSRSHLVESLPAPSPRKGSVVFDVSLSLDGCKNSLLLRLYMQRYPRLRGLTLMLKRWARRHRVLNARRGWISPYALTVMAIHFMKETNRIADLLPTDAVNEALQAISSEALATGGGVTHQALTTILDSEPMLAAADQLQDDLRAFFLFFSGGPSPDASQVAFDMDEDVVDIRPASEQRMATKQQWLSSPVAAGGLLELSEKDRWHRIGYGVLMLRDPYEGHSLGRSVEFFRAESIREGFRLASLRLLPEDLFYSDLSEG